MLSADVSKVPSLYKVVDKNYKDHHGKVFSLGSTHTAKGENLEEIVPTSKYVPLNDFYNNYKNANLREPCKEKWLVAYTNSVIASILHKVYSTTKDPQLILCEGEVCYVDNTKKIAFCKSLTAIRTQPIPCLGHETLIKIGVECVSKVYNGEAFMQWKDNWIRYMDRKSNTADSLRTKMLAEATRDKNNKYHPAWCAYWVLWAAVAFSSEDPLVIQNSDANIGRWIAETIRECVCIAEKTGIEFDIIDILERVMC